MLPGMFNRTASNAGASDAYSGHPIQNSAEFDGSSDYESRSYASADRKTNTFHWGFRILDPDHRTCLLSAGTTSNGHLVDMENGGLAAFKVSGGAALNLNTNQRFRDPHAFAMLSMRFDTTQATDSDRVKFWWNGIEGTWDNVLDWPGLNSDLNFSNNVTHYLLGRFGSTNAGKLALSYFIHQEGVAGDHLTVGEFFDGGTKYRPIDFSGIDVGTEGVILDFTNGSDLGEDQSSNGNDWTISGSPNQIEDSPTKNYPVFTPLAQASGTLSDGNRSLSIQDYSCPLSQELPQTGIWQIDFELTAVAGTNGVGVGLLDPSLYNHRSNDGSYSDGSLAWGGSYGFCGDGTLNSPSAHSVSYGSSWHTLNNVVSVIYNADADAIWFAVNGALENSATGAEIMAGTTTNAAFTGVPKGLVPFAWSHNSGNTITVVNGADGSSLQSITGLTVSQLLASSRPEVSIVDPEEHFNAVGYTGTGAELAITGVGFQPDKTWIKDRDSANRHQLYDVIRGATNYLEPDTNNAEGTEAQGLKSFDSDGFTVGTNGNHNTNTNEYISWNLKGGGVGVANSDGSINSTVSANDDAGFSIVEWTGTGSAGTVGHGLSAPPELIIVKNRIDAVAWPVYHAAVAADAETDAAFLDLSSSFADDSTYWNDVAPTSSVFSLGSASHSNGSSDDMIAYCFRYIPGFSKVFSYKGNGNSDGPLIYLDFEAEFIITKRNGSSGWTIHDRFRNPHNPCDLSLRSETNSAEGGDGDKDINSNVVKIRNTGAEDNSSGSTYVGFAVAKNPFGATNIPLGLAA